MLPWAAEMLLWAAAWLLWTAEPHLVAQKWLLWSERRLLWAARMVLGGSTKALDVQIVLWLERGSFFAVSPKFANQRDLAELERKPDQGGQKNDQTVRTYD